MSPSPIGGFVAYGDYLELEREAAELRAQLAEALKDAERHRTARTLFAVEDVTQAVHEMRGFTPDEAENLKYDAAIDAAKEKSNG